jgi:DNA-binding response OmpR family regulator
MKLLLVEDDADLACWVTNLMQVEQFSIDWAQTGERAETLLGLQCYDAVLLDLRLPGISGKAVLARLRRKRDNVPVLMLTANGSTDDKVACFSAGADDYVVKPFDARELVARIKALIRRQAAGDKGQSIDCGNLRYLFDSREFVLRNELLPLRRREHAILEIADAEAGQDGLQVHAHRQGICARRRTQCGCDRHLHSSLAQTPCGIDCEDYDFARTRLRLARRRTPRSICRCMISRHVGTPLA